MQPRTRSGPYTFADFLELVYEDQKADLLDGVIYMASPESLPHNKLVGFLYRLVSDFVEHQRLGEVVVNKVAFRIADKGGPEPDVAFVHRDRAGIVKHGYVDGPPDFVIEVVSPDSVDRDYELKRTTYENAGVGEYWIIDPEEQSATFLVREGRGFVERQPEAHVFRATALPGFWIDVRWLWQQPLPPTMPIVQSLIAGPKAG